MIAPEAEGCGGCPAPDLEICFLMCDAELDRCIDGGWGGDGNYCMEQYEACEDDCIANCS